MTRTTTPPPAIWPVARDAATAEDEPSWLRARREAAMARFREHGFPTTRDEAWRKTNVAAIAKTPFEAPPVATASAAADEIPQLAGAGARIVFVGGRYDEAASQPGALGKGVRLRRLAEAIAEEDPLLEAHLGRQVDGQGHAFAALNTALFRDGVLVHASADAEAEGPIEIVHVAAGREAPAVVHPRLLVVAERGSRVAVLERFVGRSEGPWLTNAAVEVVVGENARVDHLKVEAEDEAAWHVGAFEATLARDARLATFSLSTGGAIARHDIGVHLTAPGSSCHVDGVYAVHGDQHVDHTTSIDHATEHGSSHQLYKGILDDRASAAFAGRVLVRQDAQHTDARQANHNLLLSRDAIADSKPQLEIFADDVKCAHGATIGQLDEDALFYLRTRGIDTEAARALLVRAFVAEVPRRIPHEALRMHAEALLAARLDGEDGR